MTKKDYDFGGWATVHNLRCSDGRTILPDAFAHQNGTTVPLVWQHMRVAPENVLGRATLEHRKEGIYAYCSFNDTEAGQQARAIVKHGDVNSLSIAAGNIKETPGRDVLHGSIREVSLVLSGANPGAKIEEVLAHGDYDSDEFDLIIHSGEQIDTEEPQQESQQEDGEKTIADILEEMTEEQKNVVDYLLTEAIKEQTDNKDTEETQDNQEGDAMRHNVFENQGNTIQHEEGLITDEILHSMLEHGFKTNAGSFRETLIAHANDYGIKNLDRLFPDPKLVNDKPEWLSRNMGWVSAFWGGLRKSPFSRIKTAYADITPDAARARGYVTGARKFDEVFEVFTRSTTPTTVYKKQKLDRDDILDMTTFDLVTYVKGEMRMMLDEEIARAVLVGDGREVSSPDKIKETNIRPIWKDDDLYTVKQTLDNGTSSIDMIDALTAALDDYEGTGDPILYAHRSFITKLLLLRDADKRRMFNNARDLADQIGVREIVTVPIMKGLQRDVSGGKADLRAIIVNPVDYTVGADAGGQITSFDQFDINYNQQHLLLETRCSGALTKIKSAVVLEEKVA